MNEIEVVSGYLPGSIGRITQLHALYYRKHWGFGLYFERKVATELSEFLDRFDESRDGFWLATLEDRIIGSVALDGINREGEGAHLRWFIVETEHQGRGGGKALLRKAVDFSRERAFRRMYLWTFAGLEAARHLYESHGFALCREHCDDQWGISVKEQMYERILTG